MNRFILTLLLCTMAITLSAQSVTIDLGAQADNTMYQFQINNSNALGANLLCGTNGGNYPRRPLIRFNVSGQIPAGSTILSVTLHLNCSLTRNIADSIKLHKLLAAWGEGTSNAGAGSDGAGTTASADDATWQARFHPNILWTNPGGDYLSVASAGALVGVIGDYSWSSSQMVTDVQNWLDNPTANFGWILICNETVASTARKFGSKDNSVAAYRPRLSVTYNPPAATSVISLNASGNPNFIIYPNPAGDFIHLKIPVLNRNHVSCRMVDMYGKIILEQRISNQQTGIDIRHVPPAVYIVQLLQESGEPIQVSKLVKHN